MTCTSPYTIELISGEAYLALDDTARADETVVLLPTPKAQKRGILRRTPFGVLAPSLMELFGIEAALLNEIVENLVPRCSNCHKVASRSPRIETLVLPTEGFLLAVFPRHYSDIPLRERCELLGAERVYARDSVLRVEDILDGDEGEPIVVLMSASHREQFQQEVSRWFERGAELLQILHLLERDGRPMPVTTIARGWRCVECEALFPEACKLDFVGSDPCGHCKGQGWLEQRDGLLHACEACRGFGSVVPQSRYEWHGIEFRHVAGLSCDRTRALLTRSIPILATLCDNGFGQYPLGSSIGELTPDERLLTNLTSARISIAGELSFALDGAALGCNLPLDGVLKVTAYYPETVATASSLISKPRGRVVVREIESGPLRIPEMVFPLGGATALRANATFAGALLLAEISSIFQKRRKFAARCSFDDLKECHFLDPMAALPAFIGDLLGIGSSIAQDLARTRVARERGLESKDFEIEGSRLRCTACLAQNSGSMCEECGDARLDILAGSVTFGGSTYSDILCAPLDSVAEILWQDDVVSEVIRALPRELTRGLTLATKTSSLTNPERRALYLIAGLVRFASATHARNREMPCARKLILVNSPCSIATAHQGVVWQGLKTLIDRGATVVCTGVPETLENCFGSVLGLRTQPDVAAADLREYSRYDLRYNRKVILEVVR